MAVSVDRVYQTVLALANKEQRGYITPQEFNLFANHAQNEIFEQYFYDLNQFLRAPTGNNTVTSDIRDLIEEKISTHMVTQGFQQTNGDVIVSSSNVHKLESVRVSYDGGIHWVLAEELEGASEIYLYEDSKLAKSSSKRPVFTRLLSISDEGESALTLRLRPVPAVEDTVEISYITRPPAPRWTYVLIGGDAIWNPGAVDKRDFQLHQSEEKNLVVKILKLAGVAIKDPNLAQVAGQQEGAYLKQEKS